MAEFLSPVWEFLFDKLGVFGIVIAASSPMILIAMIVVTVIVIVNICGAITEALRKGFLRKAKNCERRGELEMAWKYYAKYLKKGEPLPEDYFRMGLFCLKGQEVGWELTDVKADPVHWLKLAANAEHLEARFLLAKFRYRDHFDDQPLESARAVEEIRCLAAKNCNLAADFIKELEQQLKTHLARLNGRYDIQCAAMGHRESQLGVACSLEDSGDLAGALQWYLLAAEGGESLAQYRCAELYRKGGSGIVKDLQKTHYWCQKAADQGDIDAAFRLGTMYITGEGCEKSTEKAIQWFEEAAKSGDAFAEYSIAQCYRHMINEIADKKGLRNGFEIHHDPQCALLMIKAKHWAKLAREHGYPDEE